jgi:hypothetical protein
MGKLGEVSISKLVAANKEVASSKREDGKLGTIILEVLSLLFSVI